MPQRSRSVQLYPEHERRYTYTQGRWVGSTLYLAGLTDIDDSGRIRHPEDLVAQLSAIYELAATLLHREGLGLDDIVREVIYTVDIETWRTTAGLRANVFTGITPPPGAVLGVTALADPDALIEVEITAAAIPLDDANDHV